MIKTDEFCHNNAEDHLEVLGRMSDVLEIAGSKTTPSFIGDFIKNTPMSWKSRCLPLKKMIRWTIFLCSSCEKSWDELDRRINPQVHQTTIERYGRGKIY